jgi:hypothetical protein
VPAARKLLLDGQGPFTSTWDAVLTDFQHAGFPPQAGLGELGHAREAAPKAESAASKSRTF